MLAQRKYEAARPIVRRQRRRRRVNLLRAMICNRMVCVLALALAVSFLLTVYVSAYARATQTGYERGDLLRQLASVRQENQSLRFQKDGMRAPDMIAGFAAASGMVPGERMAYLKPVEQPSVAQNN